VPKEKLSELLDLEIDKKVFVECKPDMELIKFIVAIRGLRVDLIHSSNKSKVLKNTLKNAGSVGIIDEDPRSPQPGFLRKFKEIRKDNDLMIRIYRGPNGSILIELRPRLEEWLLRLCSFSGINPDKYGFPSDSGLFKKIINQKLGNFERCSDVL